ncbi:MAG: hypothetical protein ABIG43_02065, partial [Chloroflexota bacterium]
EMISGAGKVFLLMLYAVKLILPLFLLVLSLGVAPTKPLSLLDVAHRFKSLTIHRFSRKLFAKLFAAHMPPVSDRIQSGVSAGEKWKSLLVCIRCSCSGCTPDTPSKGE